MNTKKGAIYLLKLSNLTKKIALYNLIDQEESSKLPDSPGIIEESLQELVNSDITCINISRDKKV